MLIRINSPVDVSLNGLTSHLNSQITDASEALIAALDAVGADYEAYDPKNPPAPKVDPAAAPDAEPQA